jgi:hypothetical protein
VVGCACSDSNNALDAYVLPLLPFCAYAYDYIYVCDGAYGDVCIPDGHWQWY